MKRPILTREQRLFSHHKRASFLQACPGSGKTRAIVGRVCRISQPLPPRKGIAVLSFTNTAVDEFKERCHALCMGHILKHPSFVGTFDAFIRHFMVLPSGIPGVDSRPTIVDSWRSLGIDVRLRGRNAFAGQGVPLDSFDAQDGTIDHNAINHAALRAHVQAHVADYQQAATGLRRGLIRRGYLSAIDARVMAVRNLQNENWARSLGEALAGRFAEVIIDEAQDCNSLDLELLNWLRNGGIPVTVVCDPDQAIYGFRRGDHDPQDLQQFAATYDDEDRLALTGNFRSTSPICSIAATLRERAVPDRAVGEIERAATPVQLLIYGHGEIPPEIGVQFTRLVDNQNINRNQAIVLAHNHNSARRAAGLPSSSASSGTSKVAVLARAIGSFWSSHGSNRAREAALRDVEKLILQLMGKIEDGEPIQRATERNELNSRWLRRTALELITCLPAVCGDTDADRTDWLNALHAAVRQCQLDYADGVTETSFFTRRGRQDWNRSLQPDPVYNNKCATVHEAKGREYDAVCLVIPPNRAPLNRTERLFVDWEQRTNDEAKRVVYVGITRATKLIALAVPEAYRDRLEAILEACNVAPEAHELG